VIYLERGYLVIECVLMMVTMHIDSHQIDWWFSNSVRSLDSSGVNNLWR